MAISIPGKLLKNPFLLFSPFLFLYVVFVFIYPTTAQFGDESRYIAYAKYLMSDFDLSARQLNIDFLGNGPGYPIFLIPLVALKLPLITYTIVNALLYYLSVVFVFKTLIQFTSFSRAAVLSVFWGCHFNLLEYMRWIYTETICAFLISLFAFLLTSSYLKNSRNNLYLSGFVFGYLALVKPIFGYVLLCFLIGGFILGIRHLKKPNYRKFIAVVLVAVATTLPYLVYTYHQTGKVFYWSSFGGNNLYWMSSPAEKEHGDWFSDPDVPENPDGSNIKGYKKSVLLNHQKDFEEINQYEGLERDDAFKKIALNNIRSHPLKFIENCFANAGRILFNFPYSYTLQKPNTLFRLPFNGIITVLLLICIIPTIRNWKRIDFSLRFLLFFALIYLGGSVLGSAETRMFTIIVPVLLIFIGYIFQKSVRIHLGKWKNI